MSTVQTPDVERSFFSILGFILQWDTLLFILVVDYIMTISVEKIQNKGFILQSRQSSEFPAKFLTDTNFADYIAFISDSVILVRNPFFSYGICGELCWIISQRN